MPAALIALPHSSRSIATNLPSVREVAAFDVELQFGEALLDRFFRQHFIDLRIELRDDGGRRLRRRAERVPGTRDDAWDAELGEGRDIRDNVDALLRGREQNARLARLMQRKRCRHLDEGRIDVAGDQIVEGRRGAFVRYMRHLHAQRGVEHLAGEMRGGAGALRRVVQLAGIGLHVGDEFLAALGREIRPHHQHVRNLREHRDDLEALHLVVHLLVEIAVDRERRARRRHQRVAVGRRVIHGLGADIATGAGTVLDHEGLPELFTQAAEPRSGSRYQHRPLPRR